MQPEKDQYDDWLHDRIKTDEEALPRDPLRSKKVPMKEVYQIPASCVEGLDREIYMPYQFLIEKLITGEYDNYSLIDQWMMALLGQWVQQHAIRSPAYKNLVIYSKRIVELAEQGKEVFTLFDSIDFDKKHIYNALVKLGAIKPPIIVEGQSLYTLASFPEQFKKAVIYKNWLESIPETWSMIRKRKLKIYLRLDGIFIFPTCANTEEIQQYPTTEDIVTVNDFTKIKFADVNK
ncbi:MAG: hypothetical protein [Bacteriophage sp.]|nr:MAG: hypothetical protein [Bacteriophage sp.]